MMHSVSFELSFIGDKMRTAAQETAPQTALRDCSKETVGEGQYIWFWRRGSSMQLSTHFINGFLLVTTSWCHHGADVIMIYSFSRYEKMQRLGSWNQFLRISNYLKTCSTRFPGAECLTAPWTASAGTEGHQQHKVLSPQRQRQMLLLLPCCCSVTGNALGKCQFVTGNQLGFPGGSAGKESACSAGDLGLIPGLERSPGEGNGYPLQDSGLENSMDRIVHGVTKGQTRLRELSLTHSSKQL